MEIKVYLSTDGKHTVEASNVVSEADVERAQELYDKILAKYGTKQKQAAEAYAKKDGFPNDEGPKATYGQDAVPICPDHHKPMTNGKWGWYCKTPVGDGWCKYKPKK